MYDIYNFQTCRHSPLHLTMPSLPLPNVFGGPPSHMDVLCILYGPHGPLKVTGHHSFSFNLTWRQGYFLYLTGDMELKIVSEMVQEHFCLVTGGQRHFPSNSECDRAISARDMGTSHLDPLLCTVYTIFTP